MTTTILDKLSEIERTHQVKILYACESGSRAWGFPSPDSDYDVRFIYVSPYRSYLSVNAKEDQLGFPINDELDIYGWDLRKVLQLVGRSNTTPFEWLQSPVIYHEEEGFRGAFWQLCQNYFSRRSNIHHYLGIAKGAMETMTSSGEIKIKKLFYILRPLLAAKWCLEQNTIAPMNIAPLLTLLPDDLRGLTADLITLKSGAAEGYMIQPDKRLMDYITIAFAACSDATGDFPKMNFEVLPLDDFFIKNITSYDDKRSERKRSAAV